jgi:glycosyltransferase involved in cell wall biosynthesis
MRIAFVTLEYPPYLLGGAGTYAEGLCSRLGARGHEVVVFVPSLDHSGQFKGSPGVRVRPVPVRSGIPSSPQFWMRLRRVLRKEGKFDMVHINSAACPFLFRKRLSTCPQVLTLHHLVKEARTANRPSLMQRHRDAAGENGFFLPQIERTCVRAADRVIAVSAFTAAGVLEQYHLNKERVTMIPNGLDHLPPTSAQAVAEVRQKYALGTGAIILFVGRFEDPRKGFDVLLEAFPKLGDAQATLVVVGKGGSSAFEDRARSLGISDRIVYTGYIDPTELAALYGASTICAISSRMEGFGLNAAQAMAWGKPLVASRAGALPEVVGTGEELVPVDDPDALARSLSSMLHDASLRHRLGNENRERARSFPTWEAVAGRTEEVYSSLVGHIPFEKRK